MSQGEKNVQPDMDSSLGPSEYLPQLYRLSYPATYTLSNREQYYTVTNKYEKYQKLKKLEVFLSHGYRGKISEYLRLSP